MSDNLIDLATRQQVYLERLKAGHARDFVGVSVNMRENIRAVLSRLEVDTLDLLSVRELNTLLVELQAAHLAATAQHMGQFLKQLSDVASFAVALEITQAASLATGTLPQIRFNAPTAGAAYKRALRQPIQATGDLLKSFVENWPKADALRVNKAVRVAWSQGKPTQQAVRELLGTKAKNYADGQIAVSRRHATTTINTATQHVANSARQELWEKNSELVKGYHWVATLDRRTSRQCKGLEEMYGVGKKYFLPGQGPVPPIHVNCRSSTASKLDSKYDFLDEGATRASSGLRNKQVDSKLTYYSWLQQQPEKFQVTALGKKRAKLFRDGGLSAKRFAELDLDRNFKPITLAEMREIEPAAFDAAGL
jgi:SPP1 gp7 family putative phage head morphogenesis protein